MAAIVTTAKSTFEDSKIIPPACFYSHAEVTDDAARKN